LSYLYLFGAVVFEVAGTLLLPLSNSFTKILPSAALTVCCLISFYFLSFAIKIIPIAIVYATWAGLGVFLVAFLSYVFFGQVLQWQAITGLLFIVVGVTLVNSFSAI
jgi:small multidrug resistance pump